MALSEWAISTVTPNLSSMFTSHPSSTFQSKKLMSEPKIKCSILIANGSPGHILLPPPNGITSKLRPLTSISDPINLSGSNDSGFSQTLESLPIAHVFTRSCASLGIVKPAISTSCCALRGSNNGTTGCNRKASFTTACRYGSLGMSASSTGLFFPKTPLISS